VNPTTRRPAPRIAGGLLSALVLAVSACTQVAPASPSAAPSGSPSASPSASTAAVSPSPAATATATVIPSASPSATPVPTICPIAEQQGNLPSDRLIDMKVATSDSADTLTFVFGKLSLPGPGGQPVGDLMVATKPYSQGGSGQPIVMDGDRVIQVRFMHMSLQADTGETVYQGPDSIKPRLPALRQATVYDAFEGQMGFYVGFDGPGCVTLERVGQNVVLTFAH
jgi:hypothetical protein